MILRKWNYKTKQYDQFDSPAQVTKVYSENMDERVDCAQCGKQMTYGDGYTSREVHNTVGYGYPVCEECYNDEWERDNENR